MSINYTKFRNCSFLSFLLAFMLHTGIMAQCVDAPPVVVPNEYENTTANLTFLGPFANSQRTYQLLINANQNTDLVGKQLTGITFRLPANATSAWPAALTIYDNYDIYLSESVAPADRSLTFANNVAGPQTQVRDGSLSIAIGDFSFGSDPNEWGVNIEFDTPYEYTGGHLLVEIRHDGSDGASRSIEAVGTSVSGYGTNFSACWTSNYAGTSGSQGNFGVVRFTSQECGVVVVDCPTFSSPAPAVQVTNSSCGEACNLSSGSITAPSATCPEGSTLQYSTNGGSTWSTSLPTYNQAGPAQTILTRCNCDDDNTMSSLTSSVTTAPAGCALPSSPSISITNNVCPATTGSISASGCGPGTVLEYATSPSGPWNATPPAYTADVFTVYARCRNTTTTCISTISSANTAPVECSVCPDLSAAAPAANITNSYCANGCNQINGVIVQANKCPFGSTVQYSTNGGSTWSATVPTYNQEASQTILTRCNCNIDNTESSPTTSVTTAPNSCVIPGVPTINISNNVCPSTSGSISASGCGAGTVVEYASSALGRWSTTPPAYTSTAFTVYARCRNTTTGCISTIVSATTAPTNCGPNLNGGSFDNLGFNVYPNPAQGEVMMNLKDYLGKSVKISLYTMEGKVLRLIHIDQVEQNVETLYLNNYNNGMYFVKISSEGMPDITKRIVINK